MLLETLQYIGSAALALTVFLVPSWGLFNLLTKTIHKLHRRFAVIISCYAVVALAIFIEVQGRGSGRPLKTAIYEMIIGAVCVVIGLLFW